MAIDREKNAERKMCPNWFLKTIKFKAPYRKKIFGTHFFFNFFKANYSRKNVLIDRSQGGWNRNPQFSRKKYVAVGYVPDMLDFFV